MHDEDSISATNDGGFIIGGHGCKADSFDLCIVKIDSNGNVIWVKSYPGLDGHSKIISTADGGIIILSDSWSLSNGLSDIIVLKLDSNGDFVWAKKYFTVEEDYSWDIRETSDGGYLFAAEINSIDSSGYSSVIVRIDEDGDIQWQKLYDLPDTDRIYSIRILADGSYVALGIANGIGNGVLDIWAMREFDNPSFGQCPIIKKASLFYDNISIIPTIETVSSTSINYASQDTTAIPEASSLIEKQNCPVPPEPDIKALPLNINFGTTMINNIVSKIQTVHNEGLSPLHILSVNPPQPPFYLSFNNCIGNIIYPGESCIIEIKFSPLSIGDYFDSFSILSDDPDEPVIITGLKGIGDIIGDNYWIKKYYGGDFQRINHISSSIEGGIILAGEYRGSYPGNTDGLIAKLDNDGNIEWQKILGGTDDDSFTHIQSLGASGYIAGGDTLSFGAGGRDIWVFKADNAGNIEWINAYGTNDFNYFYSMVATPSNDYVVLAEYNTIFKLNSDGDIVWAKKYNFAPSGAMTEIYLAPDGGYVLLGEGFFNSDSIEPDIIVAKIDSFGNIQWEKIFGGQEADFQKSIDISSNGEIFIIGHTYSFGPGSYSMLILKLNPDGSIQWQKTFRGANFDIASKIKILNDSSLLIAGSSSLSNNYSETNFIIKLDNNGDIKWIKQHDAGYYFVDVKSLAIKEDNSFYIASYNQEYLNSVNIIMKLKDGTWSPCSFSEDYEIEIGTPTIQPIDYSATSSPISIIKTNISLSASNANLISEEICRGGYVILQPYLMSKPEIDDSTSAYPNGLIEPGEEVSLRGHLQNIGNISSTNTIGLLTSSEEVDITQPFGFYGTIPENSDIFCSICYSLTVSSINRPSLHWDIDLLESISSDQYSLTPFYYNYHIGNSFIDVSPYSLFYLYIENILHNEISNGCGNSFYCPLQGIRRQQMAKFLCNAIERAAPGNCIISQCDGIFSDVNPSNVFCSYIEKLYNEGIVGGCQISPLLYCPLSLSQRQQMAKHVCLAMNKVIPNSCSPTACVGIFNDVPPSNPFCSYIEALYSLGIINGCTNNNFCPDSIVSREQMAKFLVIAFNLIM
jgi:hypothetical protein